MKRRIRDYPGTKHLKRLLKRHCGTDSCVDVETVVIGMIWCLLDLTARRAPRGDIGIIPDEDIADELGWLDEPRKLINLLVSSRWLTKSDEHRLVVTDYREWAAPHAHWNNARQKRTFVS